MKQSGKLKWTFVAGILLLILFSAGVDWIWLFGHQPDTSATYQETMRKLEIAVKAGDTDRVAALFTRREVFDEFMSVRTDSVISGLDATALRRSSKQSSLDAWKAWFSAHGSKKLIHKLGTNGPYCVDKAGSFVLAFSYEGEGYLIDHCSYTI